MNRCFGLFILGIVSFLLTVHSAAAAPITVPTGLNPGDQYRLAFVTTARRNATSPNIADYNAFVTNEANLVPELAALGTTWKAIASTQAVDARDNTNTNNLLSTGVPIYHLADALIAISNADLWNGSLAVALNITSDGSLRANSAVWTGSTSTGVEDFPNSLGLPSFAVIGIVGVTDSASSRWVRASGDSYSQTLPFYAISGVLTVVPEPSSQVLVAIGLVGILVCWRHGKRR
jgi:hypothetical protein